MQQHVLVECMMACFVACVILKQGCGRGVHAVLSRGKSLSV